MRQITIKNCNHCIFCFATVVKLLVEHEADMNALSITQATPFMRAIESASFPVVEYLLEKGAKVTQENIQGECVQLFHSHLINIYFVIYLFLFDRQDGF